MLWTSARESLRKALESRDKNKGSYPLGKLLPVPLAPRATRIRRARTKKRTVRGRAGTLKFGTTLRP